MNVTGINSSVYQNPNSFVSHRDNDTDTKTNPSELKQSDGSGNSISFQGKADISKRFLFIFRQLSNYMKEPSEMTNALIAAIGTGAIAPFAIMCSPAKKTNNVQDKKVEKDKKKFQALRQPVSAALAFGFQVPTTIGIATLFNKGAYEKHWEVFKDKGSEGIQTLIPSKKYLAKQAKKALKDNPDATIKEMWKEELSAIADEAKMKDELIKQIKEEYMEVGMDVSQEELEKLASKPKRRNKFLSEKMAKLRHDRLIDEKVKELSGENRTFKDIDLVTEDYQKLARNNYKAEFEALREKSNLSGLDKFLEAMGFSNKKLKALDDAEKALAKEKGLDIMKAEAKTNPELKAVFSGDKTARLKKYVENRDVKAQKLYSNKVFWITLATNLVMVAISCIALNWLHPKFAAFVEGIKDRKSDKQQNKKVEVRA